MIIVFVCIGYKASVNMIIATYFCVHSVDWMLITCLYN